MGEQTFDYIVVGGGSAGCIVASRLADAQLGSVLLLEAGDPAEANPETLCADSFVQAFANERTMIDRLSSAQSHCNNRHLYVGTGTGMGGSGSVNGMVYTRGDKRDFEQWPEGWQWADVAHAFTALETLLKVKPRPGSGFSDVCLSASLEAGFQHKDELNDGDLCDYMGYQLMNYDGDRRRNSYVALLKDRPRDNLTIITNTRVERIELDAHCNAVALIYRTAAGTVKSSLRRELVLCAGALETPKLLMLSGIGPRHNLEQVGVETVVDVPSVGKNLADHPNAVVFYRGKQAPKSFYPQLYGFRRMNPSLPLADAQADTCFVFFSSSISLQETMKRMLPAILLKPARYYASRRWHRFFRKLINIAFTLPPVRKFTAEIYGIVVILGKPLSRGEITLSSADPEAVPNIDLNYLEHPSDTDTLVEGVLQAKRIAAQDSFRRWGNKPVSKPARTEDRKAIAKWLKTAVNSTYHFAGSCKMGEQPDAPVDTRLQLKVSGNIRIADASVIPEVPVAALNAPSMMIGWRAADFIIADHGER